MVKLKPNSRLNIWALRVRDPPIQRRAKASLSSNGSATRMSQRALAVGYRPYFTRRNSVSPSSSWSSVMAELSVDNAMPSSPAARASVSHRQAVTK